MTTITQEDAIQIAGQYYGIVASAKPLNGYEEQNFLLTTVSGEKYILKAASQDFNLSLLQAQTSVIRHLATTALKDAIPSCISNIEGQSYYACRNKPSSILCTDTELFGRALLGR
jgi:Ser/Thr protein kinase RdoA (MazF antagonist)